MKINFVYSRVYDEMLNKVGKKELSEDIIKEMNFYKEEVDAYWSNIHKKVIKEIEKVSSLKFKNDVDCYLVSRMFYSAISNPLTIRKEKNLDVFRQRIIHELVHVLLTDNYNKIKDLVIESYPEEDLEFKNHVPVLLITRKVVENLFGTKEFEKMLNIDMRIELRYIWPEVNRIYSKFDNNIIKFLKNEKLR